MPLADNTALVQFVADALPPVGANVHSDQSKPDYPDLEFRAYDKTVFAAQLLKTVDEGLEATAQ